MHRSTELLRRCGGRADSLAILTLLCVPSLLTIAIAAAGITNSATAQVGEPAVIGRWTALQRWPAKATHTHVLPDGHVMFWPAYTAGDNPHLWNPVTSVASALLPAGFDIFCAGHTLVWDGRLFVGGALGGRPRRSLCDDLRSGNG